MTARGDRTRQRLIDATVDLVNTVGYANVTTRAIAGAAGVSEGALYRHFSDKSALFFAALSDRLAPVVASVAQLPQRAGQADIATNLLEALSTLATLRKDLVPLELALLADPELAGRQRIPGPDTALPPDRPDVPGYLADYLRAEQRLGRARADLDCHAAAITLLATLFGIAMAPTPLHSPVDQQALRAAVALISAGIENPPGQDNSSSRSALPSGPS